MEKAIVAKRVHDQLTSSENAIDAALLETTALLSRLLEARQELDLSAAFGVKAVSKVSEAIATLTVARQEIVEAHHEMDELRLRLGIRTKMGVIKDNFLHEENTVTARKAV